MHYCTDCNRTFEEPKYTQEILITDPFPDGPTISVCPYCGSDTYVPAIQCDGCGDYIIGDGVKVSTNEYYCENCFEYFDITDLA